MLRLLLLGLLALTLTSCVEGSGCGKIVCYHTNWSQYRPGAGKFFPSSINASLCTHLVYSFAKLENNAMTTLEWNDDQKIMETMQLKVQNPNLKILVAIGGWNAGSAAFSAIVQTQSTRKHFIDKSIEFLNQYGFDGLDLDWEYPALNGSPPQDKQNFALWVKELREAYDRHSPRLLLTAAVTANPAKIPISYNVKEISKHLDYISVMSYDLHGAWDAVTGHNSPLRGDAFSVENAAKAWVREGCPRDKLIVGLPLYGRAFTLSNPSNNGVGADRSRAGTPGKYTNEPGFLAYYEVCEMLDAGAKRTMIEQQAVPYLVQGDQWVGYDDPESLTTKVDMVKRESYGGVLVWALPLDDFSGQFCGQGRYPLMNAINNACGNSGSGTRPTAGPTAGPTTSGPTTSRPTQPGTTDSSSGGGIDDCTGKADGFYPSKDSCNKYLLCSNGATFDFSCAEGLVFNPALKACDYASNYDCRL